MSDFRNDMNETLTEGRWTIVQVFLKIILPIMVVGFLASWVGGVFNDASQPMKVISKTLDADNIIHKYEWFHDVYTHQQARVNQITQFKGFLADETNSTEKRRLRMEMAAQQQSCRTLVAKYNANSEKIHVSLFKGDTLPQELLPASCE